MLNVPFKIFFTKLLNSRAMKVAKKTVSKVQIDPFSPLHFFLAADVLATLVQRAQEQGFNYIAICGRYYFLFWR